ncbi:MAG TPA: DMT family transporter [Fervidobacterium sp.]|nr:DMT family transporter [Fervidobacterium sp.]HPT54587.1 DMT family transporter [Fervidobacterium sp.]HPZ18006.1 DMT family transporter [Fervidobacterium sp.]HQE48972.1 DMT family transporter [Fervidobacterium sp.]HUM42987.1 DMT family transporter [Fervidobacterium sp.]
MNLKVILSGIAMSTIFGLSFLFTKNALDYVPVYTFLSYRFGMATLVMLLLALLGVIKLSKKPYWRLWKVVLFEPILYFIFETNGLKYTTSSEAGMLIAMIPIFVVLLSPIFLKERIRWYQIVFSVLSFFGVFLIVGHGEKFSGTFLGEILILGAAFSSAFYNMFSRKYSTEFTPAEITFFMMFSGFLFFTVVSLISGQFTISFDTNVIISVLYLGVLSSTVAFFLVNFMLSKVSPTVSSLFSNLTTVISVLAGSLFRHERINFIQIVGMLLILISLVSNSYLKQRDTSMRTSVSRGGDISDG